MSDQREQLRDVVADFFETNASLVGPDFVLGGQRLASSIARAGLDAAIRRRVGAKLPAVYSATTFGELEAALTGDAVATSNPATNGSLTGLLRNVPNGVACGVDVESIANLPGADDYWEHEFYNTHFSNAEIAYCVATDEPREHFAARWVAKEALKKCDGRFLETDNNVIQVAVDENGAPRLELLHGDDTTALPHAVSLTHTAEMAVAIVVTGSAGETAEKPRIADAIPVTGSVSGSSPKRGSKVPSLVTWVALVLAGFALWRTYQG